MDDVALDKILFRCSSLSGGCYASPNLKYCPFLQQLCGCFSIQSVNRLCVIRVFSLDVLLVFWLQKRCADHERGPTTDP